jgi:hypothetical protein
MTLEQWISICGSEQRYHEVINAVAREFFDLAFAAVELAADTPLAKDIEKHALIAITFNSPDCDPAWRRLATYTLNSLDPRDDLTEEEEHIRGIAQSIYRTEQAVARKHRINLYPNDCEDAYQRALEYLAPYLKTKEPM